MYKIMLHNAGYSWVLATQNCGADLYLMRVLPQSHFPEDQLNRINKQPNKSYLTMSFPNNNTTIQKKEVCVIKICRSSTTHYPYLQQSHICQLIIRNYKCLMLNYRPNSKFVYLKRKAIWQSNEVVFHQVLGDRVLILACNTCLCAVESTTIQMTTSLFLASDAPGISLRSIIIHSYLFQKHYIHKNSALRCTAD